MQVVKIKKGLDLPITGSPVQTISDETGKVSQVALIGYDYPGMKPTMEVTVGESVAAGQVLFSDKKTPGVVFTSPASGKVLEINRGEKRIFESIVISVSGQNQKSFPAFSDSQLGTLERQKVVDTLVQSGLWTALRTRPYSKVPSPESAAPQAIFVRAMSTEPLSADANVVLGEYELDFNRGLRTLSRLTEKKVYICHDKNFKLAPIGDIANLAYQGFEGPHPAGLSGTHIHFLRPANKDHIVWTIGYQDVIAIGKLLTSGHLWEERVVAVAGPLVKSPRLVKTRLGASLSEVIEGDLDGKTPARVISGSVLSGRKAEGAVAYLGRYHEAVSVIKEDKERVFLGWQAPGFDKFSTKNLFASKLLGGKKFDLTSSTHGSQRAMVPIGMYEPVVPLDVEPTFLLKALLTQDLEMAEKLGCLELDEEDLALCTFVDPGKTDYGPILRHNLELIEKGL